MDHTLTPYGGKAFIVPHRIIWSSYTGRWRVGCYIWYSEEGPGRGCSIPRPLLAVPNVTANSSTASVPITILLYNGPLLRSFNMCIKGQRIHRGTVLLVLTVLCPRRSCWQQRAQSQLDGRSSSSTPVCVRSGLDLARHAGWTSWQQTRHSISHSDQSSPSPTSPDHSCSTSPRPQISQAASRDNIGCHTATTH